MSDRTKKIILWSLTIVIAVSSLILWAGNAQKRLDSFRGKEFIEKLNFPQIEMPKTEIPKEELGGKIEELKEIIKNAEETSTTTTE